MPLEIISEKAERFRAQSEYPHDLALRIRREFRPGETTE
jgi:hypothetical protein